MVTMTSQYTISGAFGTKQKIQEVEMLSSIQKQWARSISFLALSLLVILPIQSWTQGITGTIAGTVTDPSGAVIPGATVRVINAATQDVRKVVSNETGIFTVSGLVTGDYNVRITAEGFKTWEIAGIHVLPAERKNIAGIALAPGAITEVVVVESSAAQIQVTDSGDNVALLDSQKVSSLGLEGRDVTELIRTLPGFANVGGGLSNSSYDAQRTGIVGGSSTSNFSGAGFQSTATNQTGGSDLISDGARVIDPGCNCSTTQTINSDMVSEVKVTTSAFSAENAHGPVVIEAIGKSGSTSYHGSVYMHFRNSGLNANDYYDKQVGMPRLAAHYLYPGANFGGPVLFPHSNFNHGRKLIFWAGYEYYNQRMPDPYSGGLLKADMPTLSERAGLIGSAAGADNDALCSTLSTTSNGAYIGYRCNTITSMFIDGTTHAISNSDISTYLGPVAKSYLAMTPEPNYTPTAAEPYDFIKELQSSDDGFMAHARVDYAPNDRHKLYVSYNRQNDNQELPYGQYYNATNVYTYPAGMKYLNRSNTFGGNYIWIIRPTLINELNVTYAYANIPIDYTTGSKVTKDAMDFPYDNIGTGSKYTPWLTDWWGPIYGYPSFGQPDLSGYFSTKKTPSFTDTLTIVSGKHSLKLGLTWQMVKNNQLSVFSTGQNGTLSNGMAFMLDYSTFSLIDGNENALANFLTDGGVSYSWSNQLNMDLANISTGGFIQDDWKLTKKLTFNFGLRFDHFGAWYDTAKNAKGLAVFTDQYYLNDGGSSSTGPTAPGVRTHATDSSIPNSGRKLPTGFAAPRFGMAYDVFGTGKTVVRGGIGAYYYQDGTAPYDGALELGDGLKSCSITTGKWATLSGYFSDMSSLNDGTGYTCSSVNDFDGTAYPSISVVDPEDQKLAHTYTYNFAISQRTFKDSVLEVTYTGNQSVDLPTTLNKNVIPLGSYFASASSVADSAYTVYSIVNGTTAVQDSYRPHPNYGSITTTQHMGWANYNALQVTWNRMRGNLTWGLNYTFSKTMGLATTADPIKLQNDYGPMSQDRTHVFNATYAYRVGSPIRHGALLKTLLNQWTITGISAVQSGANVLTNGEGVNLGLTGTDANAITNPTYNTYVEQEPVSASYYLGSSDYTLMPKLTCARPNSGAKKHQYINVSCFSLPDKANYSQRYWLPYTHGPKFFSNDLTVSKGFAINDKQNVELKLSAFNWLNHALPGFDLNATTSNIILSDNAGTFVTSAANPSGGTVPVGTPTTKLGHRVAELSLTYSF
jgi:hypothetical protein